MDRYLGSSRHTQSLTGARRIHAEQRNRATAQTFDHESGQIYNETEVYVGKRFNSDWIGEYRSPNVLKKPGPNQHGARSLFEMAKLTVADEMRSLNSEHLAVVPWSLGKQLWNQVVSRRAESFHTWRIFASAYFECDEFAKPEYRYLLELRSPSLQLQDYFKGITSSDMHWLTCLRISPKFTLTPDLVAISKIRNLAVLDLSDGQVTIDNKISLFEERIMRTWAELAISENAFRHLRVLLLGWQENVSTWLFKYLEQFPSLTYIILTDCPKMHQRNRVEWEPIAKQYGWEARSAKKSVKTLRPHLDDGILARGAVSGLHYDCEALHEELRHPNKPLLGNRPLLECWIGNPRLWTHIMDDFPGTRTIFFENVKPKSSSTNKHFVTDVQEHKRTRQPNLGAPGTNSPPPKRVPKSKMRNTTTVGDLLRDFYS